MELGQRLIESKLELIEVVRVRKGQHHHSFLHLGGALVPAELKHVYLLVRYFP